jgi:integrase
MAIHKRKRRGKIDWYFKFDLPGATRESRRIIRGFGYAARQEAIAAEANRRIDEQKKIELARAGAGVDAPVPKTLAMLLVDFFQYAEERLAPKTVERYKEQAVYISSDLLAKPFIELTALHWTREWARLLKSGGRDRKTKSPRPLSAKTVRNIAGVISSAYSRAIKWGLTTVNPVTNSEPPKVKRHRGIAFTPAQQRMAIEAAASGPWCLRTYLEVVAATGCRRGEMLALTWGDIKDGRAMIARSLCQTRDVLAFKSTKTEEPRPVSLPASAIAALGEHRKRQDEFRRQFGADYSDLDLIFANPDGTPFKPDSISAAVSLQFRRLKLPKGASLHSLRHTHCSHLLASGVPLPAVSARLGHGSIRTTQEIYSHMIHGQDDEAARKWEEFQKQTTGEEPQQKGRVQ